MVMRTLISKVATCNKLLFVCPPVCSYPPLSYLKGLLLVQTFFPFTACCDYAFLLFPPSFYSYALFSFAPIPCFLSFLFLFPFVLIPCFLSLLCTFSYFLVVLACPILCNQQCLYKTLSMPDAAFLCFVRALIRCVSSLAYILQPFLQSAANPNLKPKRERLIVFLQHPMWRVVSLRCSRCSR